MIIFDLYYRIKYKSAIQDLGFEASMGKYIHIPIIDEENNMDKYKSSIVVSREQLLLLFKDIPFKNNRDRVIIYQFNNWLRQTPSEDIATLPLKLIRNEKWLHSLLKSKFFNIEADCILFCIQCQKEYQYFGSKNKQLKNSNTSFLVESKKIGQVLKRIYCPNNHLLYDAVYTWQSKSS